MPSINLQQERDHLLAEIENLAANSDGQTQKTQDIHSQKLKTLEAQVNLYYLAISFCHHVLLAILIFIDFLHFIFRF